MSSQSQHHDLRIFLLPMEGVEQEDTLHFLFTHVQVAEIIGYHPIQKIPFSDRHLLGIIPYQNQLLPVINVSDLCAPTIAPTQSRYKQLMIIRTGAFDPLTGEPLKLAIMANTAIRTLKLSSQALTESFLQQEPPPWLQASKELRGFFKWQDTHVALLHLDHLAAGSNVSASPHADKDAR